MTLIGDNGGPPIDTALPTMKWVKLNIDDFLDGVSKMSMEQRGFYITALLEMYRRVGALPFDEREGSWILRVDIRVYRRVRDMLIETGKFYRDGDLIRNARVEQEIADFCRSVRKKSEAASEREARKRAGGSKHELQSTSVEAVQELPDTSGEARKELTQTKTELETENVTISKGATPRDCQSTGTTVSHTSAELCHRYKNKKEGTCDPSDAHPSVDELFEAFWQAFPGTRKRGKGDAAERFRKIVNGNHRSLRATGEQIVQAVRERRGMDADPKFAPMPATWLNGGRWADPPPSEADLRKHGIKLVPVPASQSATPADVISPEELERQRAEAEAYYQSHYQ